ncbi:hypothetical protein ACJX0J_037707 [Zea mays]
MLPDITKAFDSVSWPFLIEKGLDYSTLSLQPIVDKIANQLLGWKADLLTKAGISVLVQSVLTGDIDKIRRGVSTNGILLPFSGVIDGWEAIEDNGWINDIPGSLSIDLRSGGWIIRKNVLYRMLWWHQANEAIQGDLVKRGGRNGGLFISPSFQIDLDWDHHIFNFDSTSLEDPEVEDSRAHVLFHGLYERDRDWTYLNDMNG